ncbi:unnamed protein product [Protopolystoma xenopodis]|uniref:Uncharacterized protein n=1 Tax=Protopolystoma xenopodis TaxID=117903 RepID=A0A3S5BD58_9PLAT|nr:unnamed protein product [Protopolystoma xenopodis]
MFTEGPNDGLCDWVNYMHQHQHHYHHLQQQYGHQTQHGQTTLNFI